MSLKVELIGTNGDAKIRRADMHQREEYVGQVVYTDQLLEFEQNSALAFNSTLGIEMAVDASFGGTPDPVHNGTDSAEWTGSNISGSKVTFDSTGKAYEGTKSVKVNSPTVNNVWQFDQGSTFTPANYTALTFYVFVESNWITGGDSVEVYGWDTGTSSEVGDRLKIESFFNEDQFGFWQKATIPLDGFNFNGNTFEALRMEFVSKTGPAPVFYMDKIQFEETGGVATFDVTANKGHVFNVNSYSVTMIGPHASALVNTSIPNLDHTQFLDLASLATGITFSRVQKGVTAFAAVINNLGDLIKGGGRVASIVGDGTNSVLVVDVIFDEPVPLDSRFTDSLSFTISDDLSSLTSLTILARGRQRNIGNGTVTDD